MKKVIDLHLNYFAVIGTPQFDKFIKKEFYAAKDELFKMGYEEYVEEKSLPLNPKDQNIFYPLATWRVKDKEGNFDWINIFQHALGGMVITNEI